MFASVPSVQPFVSNSENESSLSDKNMFDDRSDIFELLEGEVDDMYNPTPTFLKSLKEYASLNLREEDVATLTSVVRGNICVLSYQLTNGLILIV